MKLKEVYDNVISRLEFYKDFLPEIANETKAEGIKFMRTDLLGVF